MNVSLTGSDTIISNGRVLNDFADDDVAMLSYPNSIAGVKTGKNGNSLYALNETGNQAEVKLRVLRGSADDKYLNNLLTQQMANFAGTVLNNGQFVKKVGDGAGNITADKYIMSGGVFMKRVEVKSNVAGDTNQSVVEYNLTFSNAPRILT